MSPSARNIAPEYVRLSGEIVDQAILNHLREQYPAGKRLRMHSLRQRRVWHSR